MWWYIAYAAIAVVLIVPFQRLLTSERMGDLGFDSKDRAEVGASYFIAVFMAAFWPAIAVALVAIRISKAIWDRGDHARTP